MRSHGWRPRMRTLIALATLVALLAAAPGVVQAQDPCPNHCTPPKPCGWPPDVRKYPVQYAQFWVDCVEGLSSPVLLP